MENTTLEMFIEEQKKNLEAFRLYWIAENKKNPEYFPMSFESDNNGLWFEMFEAFVSEQKQ